MTSRKPSKGKKTPAPIVPAQAPQGVPAAYTPFADVDRLFQAMNRRFSDVFGVEPFAGFPSFDFRPAWGPAGVRPVYSDIVDEGDRFAIRSDLPGVKKDDIQVSLHGSRVEISATTTHETSSDGRGTIYRERSQGSYFRALDLPDEIEPEKVEAKFVDGVLTLTLPKKNPSPVEKKTVKVQ